MSRDSTQGTGFATKRATPHNCHWVDLIQGVAAARARRDTNRPQSYRASQLPFPLLQSAPTHRRRMTRGISIRCGKAAATFPCDRARYLNSNMPPWFHWKQGSQSRKGFTSNPTAMQELRASPSAQERYGRGKATPAPPGLRLAISKFGRQVHGAR